MKGFLKKTEEGWFVIYDQRTMQDPSAEDGILPLHFEDVKLLTQYTDYSIDWDGKEVEWDRITEWDYDRTTYAKLVEPKKDFVFSNEHIVDTNEMILDDCEEVKNWDNFAEQKNLELLAESIYGKGIKPDYEEGFIDGYNKAKEYMYTKEQMELCWIAAMINRTGFSNSVSYKEFIKSLKKDSL